MVPPAVGQDLPARGREALPAGALSQNALGCFVCFLLVGPVRQTPRRRLFALFPDQHPAEHGVRRRHGGRPVDRGLPAGEGDQQPVGVELGGGAGQRHGGPAGDPGGEEGEVRVRSFRSRALFPPRLTF